MTQTENNDSKTQGRWTKQQHEKFLLGLQLYGKDWKKIQDLIGTRNGAQIRSHAQKFFLRMKKQFDVEPSNQNPRTEQPDVAQSKPKSHLIQESQESKEYSYFVQKIVKKSHEKERFDFWEAFIDQKSCEEMQEMETGVSKRKNSFMAWDQNEIDEMSTGQPLKRVKTQ